MSFDNFLIYCHLRWEDNLKRTHEKHIGWNIYILIILKNNYKGDNYSA